MSNRNTQCLALVGAGYWGKNLARNFHALGSLKTLCDRSRDILDSYGAEYADVQKSTSFDDVLADPEITRVAIAAPAALHHRLAKAALLAGKDVYVEKPLCLDTSDAEDLVAVAREQNRILMVGHLLQYHPCVVELERMVSEGEIGKVLHITSNRLNLGKIRKEENVLWSFAPHDISVVLSLVGNQLPEQVISCGEAYLTPNVADTSLTALKFRDGVRAQINVSWLNPFKEQKLTVVGSKAMLVFDDRKPWAEKLTKFSDYLKWDEGHIPTPIKSNGELVTVPQSEPLMDECAHFMNSCEQRSAPMTDGGEGLRVLKVLKAAQESMERDGEAVTPGRKPDSTGSGYFAHASAFIDEGVVIGKGSNIWHFSHVMFGSELGENCNLGQNVVVSSGVILGCNVKVQNNVSIYTGTIVEDDVFLGPSCVLTNVTNPRSQVNRQNLYENTLVRRGATVGANATVVCGTTLGRYCFIASGAVVTKDVPDYALMVGVPAKRIGWMSRHGHKLAPAADGVMICSESGYRYREVEPGIVRCLDLDEESQLPSDQKTGVQTYRELKKC